MLKVVVRGDDSKMVLLTTSTPEVEVDTLDLAEVRRLVNALNEAMIVIRNNEAKKHGARRQKALMDRATELAGEGGLVIELDGPDKLLALTAGRIGSKIVSYDNHYSDIVYEREASVALVPKGYTTGTFVASPSGKVMHIVKDGYTLCSQSLYYFYFTEGKPVCKACLKKQKKEAK